VRVKIEKIGNNARIIVQDRGEGMEPHLIKEIFNPFFSSRDVMGNFFGHMNVKSSLKEGTLFIIEFKI